jgi:DNA end-binding protein Ku
MALRPVRSATITFGLVSIPVRFYTATSSKDISFNLLHAECSGRVNRRWWCSREERIVEQNELTRGFEISKGRYVTFSDSEIEALQAEENRALEITEFVSLDQVDPVFYERSWFLGPGDGGNRTYALLASAMRKQGKVALARWISGNREHLVLLRPYREGLILHTMYYDDEVRDFSDLDVSEPEVREKELRLAEMLIDELTEEAFEPARYRDEYRARLLGKIESKAAGEQIVVEPGEPEKVAEVVDIMEALQRSLGETAKRRPAKRAPAREKAASKKAAPAAKRARRRVS